MPDYNRLFEQVTEIQDQALDLTDWEKNFIRSVIGQFKQRGWISKRQVEIVEKIHTEKCPKED